MINENVVIVAAKRTAIANFGSCLADFKASDLSSLIIKDMLKQNNNIAQLVSEVIIGQVLTAGQGQNPARQVAIKSGLDIGVSATTINQVCGSGLKAVDLAYQAILLGNADVVIAGGQEVMSNAPHIMSGIRQGIKMGGFNVLDSMLVDGLTDVYNNYHMGVTAENIASKYNISREEQDNFALLSQQKAYQAQLDKAFKDEIVPISITNKKGEITIFDQDEYIKPHVSFEALSKLKPVFKKDGTVTAGNSSGINDGAALVLLMKESIAKKLGLKIMATIVGTSTIGVEPQLMGLGPISATQKLLQKINWQISDIDLIEANEAFAAQSIAVIRELDLDTNKVNINGGAIALGHPIGASGCRILVSLIHEMNKKNLHKGLATLCIGGGMGIAVAIER
jgi:acetyl-CoA C-acetyltransferase